MEGCCFSFFGLRTLAQSVPWYRRMVPFPSGARSATYAATPRSRKRQRSLSETYSRPSVDEWHLHASRADESGLVLLDSVVDEYVFVSVVDELGGARRLERPCRASGEHGGYGNGKDMNRLHVGPHALAGAAMAGCQPLTSGRPGLPSELTGRTAKRNSTPCGSWSAAMRHVCGRQVRGLSVDML